MNTGTTLLRPVESASGQELYAHYGPDQEHGDHHVSDENHETEGHSHGEEKWVGVDHAVIEEVAQKADRPPRDPYINTAQGDVLLFVFMLAGVIAGALAGYYYGRLFSVKQKHDG